MYVYEFGTECVNGESMIEVRVWRTQRRLAWTWIVNEVGVVYAGTVAEALAEARVLAAEDEASREEM